jgi:Tfp pilus assembly protein PilV
MLIEVVITALLVSLIVVATLTGFDSIGKATADQRYHDQAVLLASQSQEAMRSDPSSVLDLLENEGHTYTTTLNGETYTVQQTAKYVSDSTEETSCKAGSKQTAAVYARIISIVSWPQLPANRPPVEVASIITPPDGSGLEVDVANRAQTPVPIEGATVTVGQEKGTTTTTTSAEGCAIFGAIPSTLVSLEVSKAGFVTPAGEYKVSQQEISIAPNLTTHYPVTLDEGGAIEAEFVYKGATEYEKIPVTGDTFVLYNNGMGVTPEFEVGSPRITTFAAGTYEALPGTAATGYATTAKSVINAVTYPSGNLFPFASPWSVYAGDCTENRPPASILEEAETKGEASATVVGGATTKVKVPMSYVNLSVYSGTESASPGKLETGGEPKNKEEPYPIKITNRGSFKECKYTPNNAAKEQSIVHLQKVMNSKESSTRAGHLIAPFQPFGKFELCLWSKELQKTYKFSYENTAVAGTVKSLYLGAKPGFKGAANNGVTILESQSTNTC